MPKVNGSLTSSKSKSNLPLKGITCLVETLNEDGTDASSSNEKILRSLGAEIVPSLGEGITHFISSNGTKKRIMAAELMDIIVVSPLWIEQCREANAHVSEDDFLVSASSASSAAPQKSAPSVKHPPRGKEQVGIGRAAATRSIDSPFFSSSQRESAPAVEKASRKKTRASSDVSGPAGRTEPPAKKAKTASAVASAPKKIQSAVASAVAQTVTEPSAIPMPTFREYKPPPVVPVTLKQRRSERISDLADSADEEEALINGGAASDDDSEDDEEAEDVDSELQVSQRSIRERESVDRYIALQRSRTLSRAERGERRALSRSNSMSGLCQTVAGATAVVAGAGAAVSTERPPGSRAASPFMCDSRETPSIEQVLRIADDEPLPVVFYSESDTEGGTGGTGVAEKRSRAKKKSAALSSSSSSSSSEAVSAAINAAANLYPQLDAAVAAVAAAKKTTKRGATKALVAVRGIATASSSSSKGCGGRKVAAPEEFVPTAAAAAAATEGRVGSRKGSVRMDSAVAVTSVVVGKDKTKAAAAKVKATTVTATVVKKSAARRSTRRNDDDDDDDEVGESSDGADDHNDAEDEEEDDDNAQTTKSAKVVIALTGFDDKQGDRQTLVGLIEGIVEGNRTTLREAGNGRNGSRGSGSGQSAPAKDGRIATLETSVCVLQRHDDYSAHSCTHVIVPGVEGVGGGSGSGSGRGGGNRNRTRTLRVLFAVARGQWVLSESYLYQSVSEEGWADCAAHRHPRYQHLAVGRPLSILKGKVLFVARSVNPPAGKLAELVAAVQGRVAMELTDKVDFILFGDADDATAWLATISSNNSSSSNTSNVSRGRKGGTKSYGANIQSVAETMMRENRVVTSKFLFNCIEEGRLREPAAGQNELILASDVPPSASKESANSVAASTESRVVRKKATEKKPSAVVVKSPVRSEAAHSTGFTSSEGEEEEEEDERESPSRRSASSTSTSNNRRGKDGQVATAVVKTTVAPAVPVVSRRGRADPVLPVTFSQNASAFISAAVAAAATTVKPKRSQPVMRKESPRRDPPHAKIVKTASPIPTMVASNVTSGNNDEHEDLLLLSPIDKRHSVFPSQIEVGSGDLSLSQPYFRSSSPRRRNALDRDDRTGSGNGGSNKLFDATVDGDTYVPDTYEEDYHMEVTEAAAAAAVPRSPAKLHPSSSSSSSSPPPSRTSNTQTAVSSLLMLASPKPASAIKKQFTAMSSSSTTAKKRVRTITTSVSSSSAAGSRRPAAGDYVDDDDEFERLVAATATVEGADGFRAGRNVVRGTSGSSSSSSSSSSYGSGRNAKISGNGFNDGAAAGSVSFAVSAVAGESSSLSAATTSNINSSGGSASKKRKSPYRSAVTASNTAANALAGTGFTDPYLQDIASTAASKAKSPAAASVANAALTSSGRKKQKTATVVDEVVAEVVDPVAATKPAPKKTAALSTTATTNNNKQKKKSSPVKNIVLTPSQPSQPSQRDGPAASPPLSLSPTPNSRNGAIRMLEDPFDSPPATTTTDSQQASVKVVGTSAGKLIQYGSGSKADGRKATGGRLISAKNRQQQQGNDDEDDDSWMFSGESADQKTKQTVAALSMVAAKRPPTVPVANRGTVGAVDRRDPYYTSPILFGSSAGSTASSRAVHDASRISDAPTLLDEEQQQSAGSHFALSSNSAAVSGSVVRGKGRTTSPPLTSPAPRGGSLRHAVAPLAATSTDKTSGSEASRPHPQSQQTSSRQNNIKYNGREEAEEEEEEDDIVDSDESDSGGGGGHGGRLKPAAALTGRGGGGGGGKLLSRSGTTAGGSGSGGRLRKRKN